MTAEDQEALVDPSDRKSGSPGRRELALLGLAVAVAVVVRLAESRHVPFYDWDAGLFFARVADDLGAIWGGHADSQYGATHPVYPAVGFSVATRCLAALTGLSTAAAGQALVGIAAVALVPLAWSLARSLAGPGAGLLAAALVALDPVEVEYSTRSWNVLPAAALLLLSALLALGERPGRSFASGALAGAAAWLRADVLAAGPVLALLAWRNGRAPALRTAGAWLAVAAVAFALQLTIVRRNGAASYLEHVHADMLFNAGLYPDAYFVDETGLTLRIASGPRSIGETWTQRELAAHVRDVTVALGRAAGALVAAALAGLVLAPAAKRRAVLALLALALAPLAIDLVSGAPPVDMTRYSVTARPLLLVLAAAAAWWIPGGGARLGWLAPTALAACAAVAWTPRLATAVADQPRWRERSRSTAEALARIVPRGARILRGPGGDTVIVALAGARPVHMATGPTRADIARYVQGNAFEWVVFDSRLAKFVEKTLEGVRLEPVMSYENEDGPQMLARIRR
jgi:hypothetical protein